jgi:hypothetical protein
LKKLQNDNARGNGDVAAKTDNYAQKTGDNGDDRRQQKSAPEISASAPISAPPRISLSDLARANPVRFAGQKNDSPGYRPKKEVRMDELKKALNEALGGAADNEKSEK